MPYSKGGSKLALITTYELDEDNKVDYGRHRYLSQTFTISQTLVIWRCLFKSWTITGGKFYHFGLRATDAQGKPAGADIAHTTLSPTGEYFSSPGKWKRFDFDDFPELAAGTYALVASVPDASHFEAYKLRCDATYPSYPQGKAWLSHDSGETWEEIPQTNFMFQVWGYPPPPEPPPTPVISNWTLTSIDQYMLSDGYRITVTTDRPCHLFLRWTDIEPEIHSIPVERRGILMHYDRRFCFVVWNENEQEEEGDTLTHTFIKDNWPVCQTRWFYFVGTVAGEQQPSTSPIFKKHFAGVPRNILIYEPWTYYTPPPPTLFQLFLEPWGEEIPPPPAWELLFTEPWTSYWEPIVLLFREPWTYYTPPAPEMYLLFAEPWSA